MKLYRYIPSAEVNAKDFDLKYLIKTRAKMIQSTSDAESKRLANNQIKGNA